MHLSKQSMNNPIFAKEDLKKRLIWFSCAFVGILSALILSENYGFYCNLSDSFPQDYFVVKKHYSVRELHTGTIVTYPVDFSNPYIGVGKKLVKQIACDSGDILQTRGKDFFCNGLFIARALEKDSQGREIKQFIYNGVIPSGLMFLTAENSKSFDSRYFGLKEKSKVKEVGIWRF